MIKYNVDLLDKVKKDFSEWRSQIYNNAQRLYSICDNAMSSLESEIKIVEQQISMLNSEYALANQAININNNNKSKMKTQITSLEKSISQSEKEISSLNSQKNNAQSSSEKSSIESKKNNLQSSIYNAREEITKLKEKIEKINSNNAKLEHIKAVIQEEIHKCHDHQDELNKEKIDMKSAYERFKDIVVPRVLTSIDNEILPKMDTTITKASDLVKGLVILASVDRNYQTMEVDIDSGASFINMANVMQRNIDKLKNNISRCNNSTKYFSNNLNDKVSRYASSRVDETSYNIESVTNGYFYDSIYKMRDVAQLCKYYEDISIDVYL